MESTNQIADNKKTPIDNIFLSGKQGQRISRVEIYNRLKPLCPKSIYEFSKILGVNYNTLYYILRDFEFAGLINTNIEIRKGRAVKIISIPKTPEEELKEAVCGSNPNLKICQEEVKANE